MTRIMEAAFLMRYALSQRVEDMKLCGDICAFTESTDTVFGEAGPPINLNQEVRHNGLLNPCAFCPICSVLAIRN